MQRKLYATLCASAILAAGVTAASASSEHRRHHDGRHALRGVALTADQKLLSYRTDAPERARSVGRIRGMSGDTALVGIDYELWFASPRDRPGRLDRISAGTFHPDPEGVSDVRLTAAVDPAKYPILIVTAERGDGDPRPSRNVVLRSGG